jgi:hypothetical protein
LGFQTTFFYFFTELNRGKRLIKHSKKYKTSIKISHKFLSFILE